MRWLDITGETKLCIRFVVRRHPKQVLDLGAIGKKRHIYAATQDFFNRFAQRRQIFGQSPAIDGNCFYCSPAILQAGENLCVGNTIFLNSDVLPRIVITASREQALRARYWARAQ